MNELENTEESEFLFYTSNDGSVKVQIILGEETVWASQKTISEIFNTTKQNISEHLNNIFKTNELLEDSVVRKILTTAADNKKYAVNFYNLDAIIALGYRINSFEATQFRIWASGVLKEYMIKGFSLDDERLKQGKQLFGKDYFEELLEKIREIRASERMFYLKITDLYAESVDYDPKAPITQKFYATVQNKLHWAIHKHTAAELIELRAKSNQPNMGLTTWKNANKKGKIIKTDIVVAKNYLTKDELDGLNRLVSMYLDHAENLVKRKVVMKMADWASRLDLFLQFNEYELLNDAGRIKHDIACKLAEKEFEKFRVKQDKEYKSDFEKIVEVAKGVQEKTRGKEKQKKGNNQV